VPKSIKASNERMESTLCNKQVQTNRTIRNNKPDIIINNNVKEICVVVDAALSIGRNVIKKEAEKILHIKTLQQQ
jgi:hypothetical protein